MTIEKVELVDNDFSIEHIFDSPENENLVSDFKALNEAQGLEDYLEYQASNDENELNARTYLVKDKATSELDGYFTLRSGLITVQSYHESFDTIPAVELSNLAINGIYRENHRDKKRLSLLFLRQFILPIAKTMSMSKYVGVRSLYIYALPDEKLIEHYEKLGFSRLPKKQEKFVQNHVKPKYDEDCIFMFQNL